MEGGERRRMTYVSLSLLDDRDIGPSSLWLGAPEVLPLAGWPIGQDGLYAATSVRGHPDIRHQWVGAPQIQIRNF